MMQFSHVDVRRANPRQEQPHQEYHMECLAIPGLPVVTCERGWTGFQDGSIQTEDDGPIGTCMFAPKNKSASLVMHINREDCIALGALS
jgi:hypothetical protein